MKKRQALPWALGCCAALASLGAAAVTPPGTPPTFYCDAYRPADADTVQAQFNTLAVSATDRGNQPRWEYAMPSSPGVTAAPDPLPTPSSGWHFFTGNEISAYNPNGLNDDRSIGRVGFYPAQAGAVDNTLRYFRYRFRLDASVDAATYQLRLGSLVVDDRIFGIYLNGKRVLAAASVGATLPAPQVVGGGASADQQWRTGDNELAFAVYDTHSSATHLGVSDVTQSVCKALPPDVTLAPPASVTTAQTPTYVGNVVNAPAGTVVTITVSGPGGVNQSFTATTDANGNYSVAGSTLPAAGSYTVTASIPGDPTPATQSLTVTAVQVAAPQPVPALDALGLGLLGGLVACLGARQRRRGRRQG